MRIICHVKLRESADPLYTRLGIMKFADINPFLIGRFMHRCCNGKVPEIFVSYFQQNCDVHHYDTRTAQHYHIPQVKSDLAKTGIRYRGAVVWNAILSDNTNTNVSEATFKKVLK